MIIQAEAATQVDEIFVSFLREKGIYDDIWQAFAVFMNVRSVGVQVRPFSFEFETDLL